MAEQVEVQVVADISAFEDSLKSLQHLSARFGAQLSGALKSAAVDGQSLETVLRRLATNLAGLALSQGLGPLQSLAGGLMSQLAATLTGGGSVTPFARGGVVSAPAYFPMAGGVGLMGEAGAEAILPLRRGNDGRLGVAAGERASPLTVVFNVSTPDAASFRRSEAQLTGMLARAVQRGARTL
jgi:phage-related minor tail protein